MGCKTCPIPMPYNGTNGCLVEGEPRFAGTTCVVCGYLIKCEGDFGAYTLPDSYGRMYPICHPQDCREMPTVEQKAAWDAKWRSVPGGP